MKERHCRGTDPFGLPLIVIHIYYTPFKVKVNADFSQFTTPRCRVDVVEYQRRF